jgi:hypothetical protein
LALFDWHSAYDCRTYQSTSYCRSDRIVRASRDGRNEKSGSRRNAHYFEEHTFSFALTRFFAGCEMSQTERERLTIHLDHG